MEIRTATIADVDALTDAEDWRVSCSQELFLMQKNRDVKDWCSPVRTGWFIIMQNLDLKMKAFLNQPMEMWRGIRCG